MKFLFLRTWLTEFKIPKRVKKKKKRANPPLEFRVSKFL